MPALKLELTEQEQARLTEIARAHGVEPSECARALLGQLLVDPAALPQHDGAETPAVEIPGASGRKPVWMRAVEAGMALPPEERARIPRDGSLNVDHYVYGLPKRR